MIWFKISPAYRTLFAARLAACSITILALFLRFIESRFVETAYYFWNCHTRCDDLTKKFFEESVI
jgi:hypothetical protein